MFLNIYKRTKHEYNIKFKTTNLSPFAMLKREHNMVLKSGEKKSFYLFKHIKNRVVETLFFVFIQSGFV